MTINGIEYVYDPVQQINRPTLYPSEKVEEVKKIFSEVSYIRFIG